MRTHAALVAAVLALTASTALAQEPVGTAFTYQGQLKQNGVPVTGSANFVFTLWDAATGGNQVGVTVQSEAGGHPVVDGLFTIQLDFNPPGEWIYAGGADWIQVDVEYPADSGNWETLSPRQRLTATPYASFSTLATAVPWAGILDVPAGFADGVDDVGDGSFWSLTGNAGTTPSTQFLGTTDDTPLELHVNGMRALRLEPDAAAPNVIAGHSSNSVATGAYGATIAGGTSNSVAVNGTWAVIGGGQLNEANDDSATVAGGWRNWASGVQACIAGGGNNRAEGTSSFVGGGYANNATGDHTSIAGGWDNEAAGDRSTVAGGYENHATAFGDSIGGGFNHSASGGWCTIAGGRDNEATQEYATIPGGEQNLAGGEYSFAAGRQAKVRGPEDVGGGDTNGDEGTFVWADSTGDEFWSTGPDQFLIRATGGVGINTNDPSAPLDIFAPNYLGVHLDHYAVTGGQGVSVQQHLETDAAYPVYGAHFLVAGGTAYGVYAETTQAAATTTYGVYGRSANVSTDYSAAGYGGYFVSDGTILGAGVFGRHRTKGVSGLADASGGAGVYGRGTSEEVSYGGHFIAEGVEGTGVKSEATSTEAVMSGEFLIPSYYGLVAEATGPSGVGISAEGGYAGAYFSGSFSGVSGSGNTGVSGSGDYIGVSGTAWGDYGYGVFGSVPPESTHGTAVEALASGENSTAIHGVADEYAAVSDAALFDGDVTVDGDFEVVFPGTKDFVQPHPEDPGLEIVYVCLEGGENGVYVRGSGQLSNGRAEIELPEHFALVAAEEGITAQVTPVEECRGLFVTDKSPGRIAVREMQGGTSDARFDYLVMGVRRGYEEHEPIRENKRVRPDWRISQEEYEARMARPENRRARELLIENGTLNADGTINLDTANALGWRLGPKTRAERLERTTPPRHLDEVGE